MSIINAKDLSHHSINLSDDIIHNYRRLAAYLTSPKVKAKAFTMETFARKTDNTSFYSDRAVDPVHVYQMAKVAACHADTECGSVGCALGHAPFIGIGGDLEALANDQWNNAAENWWSYAQTFFDARERNASDQERLLWQWCFDGGWANRDNTPEGAGKRILYMLKNGIPNKPYQYFRMQIQRDEEGDAMYDEDGNIIYIPTIPELPYA